MTTVTKDEKQIDDLWLVKKSYLIGFFGSIGLVLLRLLVSWFINCFYPLKGVTINVLQALSVVPGSAAVFGVRGWKYSS